ncbi:ABC transporter permease, partial [Planctomycetota bacterium]
MNAPPDPAETPIVAEAVDDSNPKRNPFAGIEKALVDLGDYLNPILVKESRQALKSRHFTLTFTALLACAWGWSLFGAVQQMPRIYYAPTGMFLLGGYYVILAVPLLVIVPFSAFRSLSSEREDGTYELLAITTLSSRQIVTGKLGSAILQMIVYYSVLAPCMAFTFLLRGVDILTIFMFLFYTFLASVLFSAIGLMIASLSAARSWQMLMTVVLLFALVIGSFSWFIGFFEILDEMDNVPYDDPQFWVGN